MGTLTAADAEAFADTLRAGGVVVFPADTVYGLACDPENADAVRRLYALKGRVPDKPAAIMAFDPALVPTLLPGLGPSTRAALAALLPGAVTLLLPNPERRFPLACTTDPATLGLRVPALPAALATLRDIRVPVLQSSANRAGGPDARALDVVPSSVRDGADLVLDGGELPGTPSTVVDLRAYEAGGVWRLVRPGAVAAEVVAARLGGMPS